MKVQMKGIVHYSTVVQYLSSICEVCGTISTQPKKKEYHDERKEAEKNIKEEE